MNYTLIHDESILRRFLDWLPDLGESEIFYCSLFCRKKYWPEIKADKGQLARWTSIKERFIDKIRQKECDNEAYKWEGKPIPQDGLALYTTINPRCLVRATHLGVKKLLDLTIRGEKKHNPHQEILSCIQQAKSRSVFVDFDFDQPEKPVLDGIVNADAVKYLKTRGGWHVIVELSKVSREFVKTFYMKIQNLGADVSGDCLLPIPGCMSGGYKTPYFLD